MTTKHKACYGTMFHDTLHFDTNVAMKGKVFSFELDSKGLALSDRKVVANIGGKRAFAERNDHQLAYSRHWQLGIKTEKMAPSRHLVGHFNIKE